MLIAGGIVTFPPAQAIAEEGQPLVTNTMGYSFARLKKGEPLTIGYLGGSITEGAGASSPSRNWRSLTTLLIRERFPSSKVTEVNAAIGGTGSDLGAFRCQDDLLRGQPDLVFVEFAVNDLGKDEELILRSMEGIVRQIKRAKSQTDIIFVYTASKAMEPFYAKGQLPPSVLAHQKVAAHYGIAEINVGQALTAKVNQDHASDWKTLTRDNVHPNDEGYALYSQQVKDFLLKHESDIEAEPRTLPRPLTREPFEGGQLVDAWDLAETAGWRKENKSLANRYPHQLVATSPDADTLTFHFNGNAVGLYWLIAPDSGVIEWSIDGVEWKRRSSWDKHALQFSRANYAILDDTLPLGPHELKLRIVPEKDAQSTGNVIRIGALLVNNTVPAKLNEP